MSRKPYEPYDCGDCGAKPGELHVPGCDVERCALCGGQSIGCNCVYEINGLDPTILEEEHPDIYRNGATATMEDKLDAAIDKAGGRLPWTGLFPGTEECVEYGFHSRWVDRVTGKPIPTNDIPGVWARCSADDEGAGPDLNRLVTECTWDRARRRYVRPEKPS